MELLSLDEHDQDAHLEQAGVPNDPVIREARELLDLYRKTPEVERSSALESMDEVQGVPSRVDGFEIVRCIGRGGMGEVYLARQEDGSEVAIKFLRPGLLGRMADRRFRTEIQVLQRLDHPGIVRFLGHGVTPDASRLRYFVMEYVEGRSLDEVGAKTDLSDRERLAILRNICLAVGHAHASGVVHRDLKPSNILIDDEGRARVLDFGLARILHPAIQTITQVTASGMLMGTIRYMSPEQARGSSEEIGPASDVYSLGVLGYELMTGSIPYAIAGDETLARLLSAILTEQPRVLTTIRPELGSTLNRVFAHALEREPEDRYAGARAFGEDLDRFLDGRKVVAPRPKKRVSRRWQTTAIVAITGVLLLLSTVFALRQLDHKRTLDTVLSDLTEMSLIRHKNELSSAEIERMIDLLLETRSELARLPQSDFVGHLDRFAAWRLGECYLWQNRGSASFFDAQRVWNQAAHQSFDPRIGERLDSSLPFRPSVVEDGKHIPWSGVGMAQHYLARYERPAVHLERAHDARYKALKTQTRPFEENYTTAIKQADTSHNRGIVLRNYGISLVEYGATEDSLRLVLEGLRYIAAADTVRTLSNFTSEYAGFLYAYGNGYLEKARFTREPADLDSALVWLERGLGYSRQGTALRRTMVEVHLERSRLMVRGLVAGESIGADSVDAGSVNGGIAEDASVRTDAAEEALETARRVLDGLASVAATADRPHVDDEIERALLESAWFRRAIELHATDETAEDLCNDLGEASKWVDRATALLDELDYPVPRARVAAERARVAILAVRVCPTSMSKDEALRLIREAELILAPDDAPRFHRRLRELRAGIADADP